MPDRKERRYEQGQDSGAEEGEESNCKGQGYRITASTGAGGSAVGRKPTFVWE